MLCPMDTEQRLATLEQKIDAIYVSVEKTRTYFKWTMIGTVAMFVLPLILAVVAVPAFLSSYTSSINSLVQ